MSKKRRPSTPKLSAPAARPSLAGTARPGGAAKADRYARWILFAILFVYVFLLASRREAAYYGSVDEASYLLQARQIATQGLGPWHSADPAAYMPDNFLEVRPGEWYSKYPVGYPLLLAALYRLGGSSAPFVLNPLCALLLVAGTFALASRLIGSRGAVLAALLAACHPLAFLFGINALSHMSDACCVVWAMYFAWKWSEDLRWSDALYAGLLAGYAVSIRYTEALLALPILTLIFWRYRQSRALDAASLRRFFLGAALLFAGAILGIVPLAVYNTAAFGAPWNTGYGLTHESIAFGFAAFFDHAATALGMLNSLYFGLFLTFPMAIAGLVYLAFRRPRIALFLALWIVPTLVVYIAYYWVATKTASLYLRFFFSIYPALIIAALAALREALQRWKWYAEIAAAGVLILAAAAGFADSSVQAEITSTYQMAQFAEWAGAFARTYVPEHSMVIADRNWANYLVYVGDCTPYSPESFNAGWVARHAADANATGPAIYNPLRAQRFNEALGGRTQAQLDDALRDRLRHEADRGWSAMLITLQDPQVEAAWKARLGPDWQLVRYSPKNDLRAAVYGLVPKPPPPTAP